MRVIVLDDKVLGLPAVNAASLGTSDFQLGKVTRLALQLGVERIHVVDVNVRVAHDVRQASWDQVADVREHMREERVARNVEGHAEAHIARSLVELAVEVALDRLAALVFSFTVSLSRALLARIRHVELGKHVARGQCHQA